MTVGLTSFKLIIIHDCAKEAQRLSSMFHNAGKPCRAQHINAEANLNKILEEQSWDLIITYSSNEMMQASDVIRAVRKFEHDIPVIILTDEHENVDIARVAGMKLGACDVALVDDDQHLLLITGRELENRQYRKQTRMTQLKCKELERHNQALLDSSRDGIAYIQDGMYLYANHSFAEMVGQECREDVEFMPFIDNIVTQDHQPIKKILKNFALQKDPIDKQAIEFTVLLPEGETRLINGELLLGEHESESCTQLIVKAKLENQEAFEAELQGIKNKDSLTGLYNRTYFTEETEKALGYAIKHEVSKSFILIDVDRFSKKVKQQLSITDIDKLLKTISSMIVDAFPKERLIARISDHTFAIISEENNPDKLLDLGNNACQKMRNHLFEIGQKTLNFTLSIGICLINEAIPDSQLLMHKAIEVIDTIRTDHEGDGVNIFQKAAEEGSVLASTFKKALKDDEFKLLFQPILSLRGDETERYEILLRMTGEDKIITPPQFLKIAAELNLSKKIDRWVILESLKLLQANTREGKNIQHFISITTDGLCDNSLLPWVKVALDAAKIDANKIVFQAKEAEINQHLTSAQKFCDAAKALGSHFCISNYSGNTIGSNSSLDYVDADYVKIDGSLSLEAQENNNIETLSQLVEDLHNNNKISIIPFIEKASVLSSLWQLGVHCIQGNYLHPASDAMDYEFTSED